MTHPTDHHDDDPDMRDLLHGAVDDMRPTEGLSSIRRRLEEPAPRGRGWVLVVLATVATALVIGGVAWLNRSQVGGADNSPATRNHGLTVSTYYLGSTAVGPRLFQENRHLSGVTSSNLDAAVNQALGQPRDADYASGFPATTRAIDDDHGDFVDVDLTGPDLTAAPPGGRAAGRMALQAIVWTVDDTLQRTVPVRFTVEGTPAGHLLGVRLDGPVRKQPASSVLSPVSLSLDEGQVVQSGTEVYGQASAYEGTVVWQLEQHGHVVRHGFTTAGSCCALSKFAFRLNAPPGQYVLTVRDTTGSAGEGRGTTTDSKNIVVH
ncbi:MAG: Gmad2 immunoglobulin-like domain-containing protein [Marmoricola sp.]